MSGLVERRAPVQGYTPGIPWEMHLRAYDAYCKRHSPQPALIQGGCRGGFGTEELDAFIPGWREELSERAAMQAHIEALEAEVALLREAGLEMIGIVEGINGAMNHGTWRDESALRLKDTPQWVALYLALSAPHSPASAQDEASGTPPTRESGEGAS